MSKSFRLSSLLCILAFALSLSLGAGLAQATPINVVPDDIYAVTTNTGGVYAFNPGTYEAMDTSTADWTSSPPMIGSGNFPGSLQVDNGVDLSATGDGATGAVHNVGLALQTGSLVQQGGAIAALGKNTGDGITLGSGSFSQFGGTLVAAGENDGAGIALGSGAFSQEGGVIIATAETGGSGIYLDAGSFSQSGGSIAATGDGSGSNGIYLDSGSFTQSGGAITATGNGGSGASGYGIYLDTGDFTQSGGAITATGNGSSSAYGYGIYLYDGDFTQTDGTITATGQNGGRGIYLDEGNFIQDNGTIIATGTSSGNNGIQVNGGAFTQNNGLIITTGYYDGWGGIELYDTFTQNNGTIIALGDVGDGIYTDGFIQNNGAITATGQNGGRGIYLYDDDFIQNGGTITATGIGSGSYGIYLEDGDFNQGPDGVLRLLPGDGTGWAVYVNNDFIGSGTLAPGVDLAAGASGVIGKIVMDAGGATINPGAQLTPYLINSLALAKGTSTGPLTFMAVDGSITGDYPAPADTLTMHYTLSKTNNDGLYNLAIERTAAVSDAVSGANNSRMARSLEKGAPWLFANQGNPDAPTAAKLITAYSLLDMSKSQGELDSNARALTGSESMRLPLQALYNMDQAATSLSDHLGAFARRAFKGLNFGNSDSAALDGAANISAPAAGETSTDRLWTAWVAPLMRFDSYDAMTSDFTDLDGTYLGVSAGAARRFDAGTLGFAAHFIHGDLDGSGYDFTTNTVGINAAFRTAPLDLAASFTPWAEIALGYAYSDIDQDRDDIFGLNNNSDIDQHAFRAGLAFGHDFYVANDALRLTPIIGLDYTYISQSDYSEDGSPFGLPLDVDSTNLNSLRGKIGAELEYYFADRWAVDARAFYRYEFLDTYADTSASFQGTPIAFDLEGEDYDPSSGQLGAGLSFAATEDITLSAGYDFIFGDHYQGHNIEAAFRWEF